MAKPKTRKGVNGAVIFSEDEFLRILDRVIKPPYQETDLLLVVKGYSP